MKSKRWFNLQRSQKVTLLIVGLSMALVLLWKYWHSPNQRLPVVDGAVMAAKAMVDLDAKGLIVYAHPEEREQGGLDAENLQIVLDKLMRPYLAGRKLVAEDSAEDDNAARGSAGYLAIHSSGEKNRIGIDAVLTERGARAPVLFCVLISAWRLRTTEENLGRKDVRCPALLMARNLRRDRGLLDQLGLKGIWSSYDNRLRTWDELQRQWDKEAQEECPIAP